MVIGGSPRLGIADQYGSAHAAPVGLGLVVLIAVVVVVIIFSKRGKQVACGKAPSLRSASRYHSAIRGMRVCLVRYSRRSRTTSACIVRVSLRRAPRAIRSTTQPAKASVIPASVTSFRTP